MQIDNESVLRKDDAELYVAIDTLSIQACAGGIRVYLRQLLCHLRSDSATKIILICSNSNRVNFNDIGSARIVCIPWATSSKYIRIMTQQIVVPLMLLKLKADILFAPVDVAPLLSPIPFVTCVHSSHLNASSGFGNKLQRIYSKIFVKRTLIRSRKIIAISNFVKVKTAHLFDIDIAKFDTVYHGGGVVEAALSSGWKPPEEDRRHGGILFVGTLHKHKNVDLLLRAYSLLVRSNPGRPIPVLTIVGYDILNSLQNLESIVESEGIISHVRFMGRVSDSELLELYGSNRLLVFPSQVEGFGLPIVEAMQAGVPIVTSRCQPLPEISGDAAVHIDPYNISEFCQAMCNALWDQELRGRLLESAKKKKMEYSWHETSRRTAEIWRSARIGS